MVRMLTVLLIICSLFVLYETNRLLSSTTIWLLCFYAIFIIAPNYYPVPNEETIEWYALIAVSSFILGIIVFKALMQKTLMIMKARSRDCNGDFEVLLSANMVILFITIIFLIASIGTSGISSMISGDATLTGYIGKGSMVRNLYSFALNILGSAVLFSFFSAKDKNEVRKTYIYFVAFFLQTILFSYARSGIVYTAIIIGMYVLREKSKKIQVVIFFLVGCFCVVLMVFGGYIRSFGTNAVGSIGSYLSETEDWSQFLLSNLDFSAAYVWFSRLIDKGDVRVSPIVYLKPLLVFFPRSVFPWKPDALTVQVLKQLSPSLTAKGFSTGMSILGEAYVIAGKIGFVISPFLWGGLCSIMDNSHFHSLKNGNYPARKKVYYYYFATMIIIESHRGDFGAAFMSYLIVVLVPTLVIDYLSQRVQINWEN